MAVDADVGSLTDDDVLELELRQALKSEGEIELFKIVNKAMRIRGELASSEAVKTIMTAMWTNVADFFEAVTSAETLQNLPNDDKIVLMHQDMRANFNAVALINGSIKDGHEAEKELQAMDHMEHEIVEDEL